MIRMAGLYTAMKEALLVVKCVLLHRLNEWIDENKRSFLLFIVSVVLSPSWSELCQSKQFVKLE